MKIQVQVVGARGLRASKSNGLSDPYTCLHLGRTKAKTSVVCDSLNPSWQEDFSFSVDDLRAELKVSLWDRSRFGSAGFLGQLKLPVSLVLNTERQSIPCTWYPLQRRTSKSKTSVSGELCLVLSLYGKQSSSKSLPLYYSDSSSSPCSTPDRVPLLHNSSLESLLSATTEGSSPRSTDTDSSSSSSRPSLVRRFSSLFLKTSSNLPTSPQDAADESVERSEDSDTINEDEARNNGLVPSSFFDGDDEDRHLPPTIAVATAAVAEADMPPPLEGGILLDCKYEVSAKALNALIFKPGSLFVDEVVALQKTTERVEEPWKMGPSNLPTRVVTYMKAASKLVKSVRATEEQTYTCADERGYIVSIHASTPDVPYGGTFSTELQFCILVGEDSLVSGEKTCHLRISWRLNFVSSTIMKGMIESGARQGLRESYREYKEVLEKFVKGSDDDASNTTPPTTLPLEIAPKSDWELAKEYFWNVRMVLTICAFLIIFLHIFFLKLFSKSGIEFWRLDLPDTLREFVISAVVGIQFDHVLKMLQKFLKARVCRVSDHGKKAIGDGWLLSVTLIGGENLPAAEEGGLADPYVVFTCNGKTRTSSVKLRTLNPEWQEIFEFDATEDPPSIMDVEVFDFEGPFTEAGSLGNTEINFVKQKPSELADLWVPLQGRAALVHDSKIHLRIVLSNTKETETITNYIHKVEKKVGRKIVRRSPQKSSSFQKLFSFPSEEFLINDFACALKRKHLLHGRLFLCPRVLAFYSNIFGHKTKFSILWEDIEEIQESTAALGSVGMLLNRAILIYTRKGRALDARHASKSVDVKGRYKYQFQSFVRFDPAFKTIMALWKNRTLSPEQQMEALAKIDDDYGDASNTDRQQDDLSAFVSVEEPKMTEVYSTRLPFSVDSMVLLYQREDLDEKVAGIIGCLDYTATPWEPVVDKECVLQRQLQYKFNRRICRFGCTVTCLQQKMLKGDRQSCALDEVLTLRDVPFADNFQIQVRKEIDNISATPPVSTCKVFVGIVWHKNTIFQGRINKNIFQAYTNFLKESLDISVKEISKYKDNAIYRNAKPLINGLKCEANIGKL